MFELYTYRDNAIQSTGELMPVTSVTYPLVACASTTQVICYFDTTMTLGNPTFTISSVSPPPPPLPGHLSSLSVSLAMLVLGTTTCG